MVIIKLSFNKLERNKKMSLHFISSSKNYYEFLENDKFEGKYCKEKLNEIVEYERKNYENNTRNKYNILNNKYNIEFSPFLIDLKCKIYKRKNNLTVDKILR